MSKIPYGIRSLKIENFRGIDHLELDFTDPQGNPNDIVVIAGPNGCGKTAVLEAILLSIDSTFKVSGPVGTKASRVPGQGYSISSHVEIPNKTIRVLVNEQTKSHHHISREKKPGMRVSMPRTDTQKAQLEIQSELTVHYFSSWRSLRISGAVPISLGQSKPLQNTNVQYSSRSFRNPDGENERLHLIKTALVNSKAYSAMGGTPSLFSELNYTSRINALNRIWKRFYPQSKAHFSVEPVSDSPIDGFNVFLIDPKATRIPIDFLSAGQLELLILTGWLQGSERS